MNKKVLISVGVIAVLGIGTYAIIVAKNKKKGTENTGGIKAAPSPTPTPSAPTKPLLQTLACQYLNIGCNQTAATPPYR